MEPILLVPPESSERFIIFLSNVKPSKTSLNSAHEHAPHFGGLWEAAVKSMKMHLRRIISNYL